MKWIITIVSMPCPPSSRLTDLLRRRVSGAKPLLAICEGHLGGFACRCFDPDGECV
jgi:hypothetical protein